jgi:drug/metabolite transporter (DMT)-like permease
MTFARWLFACLLLFPIAQMMEKPDWRKAFKSWPTLLAMGVLGYIGYNMILYTSLHYTSSTNAALVSALNPGMIVVMSAIVLREKISGWRRLGIIISLIGVVTTLTGGHLLSIFKIHYNTGDLLMLGAITVWAVYSLIAKRLDGVKPITATAIAGLFTVLILMPFALAEGIDLSAVTPIAYVGMAYIVLFPSVGSFIFWNMSVVEIGASRAGVFMNLVPIFTALISVMLGAALVWSQVVGGIFVIAGVYLTTGMFEQRFFKKAT